MKSKETPRTRTPQEQCDYLAGQRDGLRQQIKVMTKELVKIEGALQAAAFAAGTERTRGESDRDN